MRLSISSAVNTLATIAAIAFVVIVGLIDTVTGLVPDLTIIYLIPIITITALIGLPYGLTVALTAVVVELLANISLGISIDFDLFTNTLLHLLVFMSGAYATYRFVAQYKLITDLEQRRNYDLDIARDIHSSLFFPLPSKYKDLVIGNKLAFARELGGDYYYFKIIDDKFFLCVADISGKSIAAALFSALLYERIDETLENSTDLIAIITRLNSALYKILPDNMFVTLFCCFIDNANISFINTGHEPPLLYSKHKNDVNLLESPGALPIGIYPDLEIMPKLMDFAPGDILLIVTDGVTESRAFQDKPFERLEKILNENLEGDPKDIVDAVYNKAVPSYQEHPFDDIIIACIKRQ